MGSGAFLLRWWRRDSGVQRIEIEHIQSDARAVVASAPAAVEWAGALVENAAHGQMLAPVDEDRP
jgi:hypothetical protein